MYLNMFRDMKHDMGAGKKIFNLHEGLVGTMMTRWKNENFPLGVALDK